ncbi:Signal transducer and activator of transcription b [Aphelenchoides bicaudatus]|nr:Signal transducer and activator of transcription b [Aphelenchoides bicaudatus]
MYSPDFMEYSADVCSPSTVSSAQSPATMAAQMDTAFVLKHNATAEVYQAFKDDVDALFAGNVSIQDQAQLISRILLTLENLLAAFDDEKQYLMGDVLCSWAIHQQKLTVATLWTQQQNYNALVTIDTQFEYFGELLEQTLNGLNYLSEQSNAEKPKTTEEADFGLTPRFRILGGRAFGLHKNAENMPVQCYLITDDTAKRLLSNAYHEVYENEEFLIEPPASVLHSDDINGLTGKFDDMASQLRRDSVATKRYCLCYNVRVTAKHGIELIGKKVSLPFAILVGPKADVEAKLFLERSFADLVRKPLSEAPNIVTYQDMAMALEMKFQSILETPQKSTDTIPLIQPKPFTKQCTQINLDNFMKLSVAEEFCQKKGSTTEGEWKLVPYYEWFFKLAEMLNKHMLQMWNDGLIYGFCGKDEAEHLLNDCPRTTLLIRFSDIEFGKIKVSVKDRTGIISHHWYDQSDLATRPLNRELLTNNKYAGIECIYPNYSLEQCLGGPLSSLICFVEVSEMSQTIESRAIRFHQYGDPQKVLQLDKIHVNTNLGPDEVLIRWLASPVNPLDINLVEGTYAVRQQLPAIAGAEGVGEIEKVGSNVRHLQPGDRILSNGMSVWAEFGVQNAKELVKIRKEIDLISAAQLTINPPTAYCMLKFFENLKPGEYVIQNAANSGVGRAAIQLAKAFGYKTINLIRDRPNVEDLRNELKNLGADYVFTEKGVCKRRKKVGCQPWSKDQIGFKRTHSGTCVTYGGMSRQAHEFSTGALVFKNIKAVGYANGPWLRDPRNLTKRNQMFEELQDLIVAGKLKPTPVQTHRMHNFAQAIQNQMDGRHGKQLLFISETASNSRI